MSESAIQNSFTVDAYLALGANVGETKQHIEVALSALVAFGGIEIVKRSSLYRNAPVGGPAGQGDYINCACKVATDLSPRALLESCLEVERRLGRVRSERWGPRTIDIDILLYGFESVEEDGLSIPHPRLRERLFALVPLSDVAPANMKLPPDGRLLNDILDEQLRVETQSLADWNSRAVEQCE